MAQPVNPGRRPRRNYERYSDTKESFVRLHSYELSLYEYDTEHVGVKRYVIYITPPKKRSLGICLTALTGAELRAWRDFFARAIELSEPNCDKLDQMAQEASDNGDDSWSRIFRRLPQLIIRKRNKPEHNPGLPLGLDGVVDVGANNVRPSGSNEPRGVGEAVPEPAPTYVGATDDAPQGGSDPGLG